MIFFNPLGTGDLNILPVPGTEHCFGTFLFLLLNLSFICPGSQFSSLFTIFQEHMSLNVIFVWHHQVHDALNDITMTPP